MPNFNSTLLPGVRLKEFEIIRILGIGGFGITYLAQDTRLGREVAIKEYFPAEFAARSDEQTISARSEQHVEDYRWGLDRFIEEAQTLAHFDHPSIVRVIQFFEANGSAYIVMEHIVGHSLSDELKEKQTLPEHRVKEIVNALLDGLEQTHAEDLLHRDIKPGNVMLREDGRPVLIDFGAARSIAGQHSRTMTAVLTPGYAPIEQYGSQGKQGPWTDIYSLGALAYKCLSGKTPQDATDRFRQDQMPRVAEASTQEISKNFAHAIDLALEVEESKRPQTITQWRRLIEDEDQTLSPSGEDTGNSAVRPSSAEKRIKSGWRPPRQRRLSPSSDLPRFSDRPEPTKSGWEYTTIPLEKYGTFSGRAQRKEYWIFHLFYFSLLVLLWGGFFSFLNADHEEPLLAGFGLIVLVGGILPMLAVTVRRLHDINLSGWWCGAMLLGTAFMDYYSPALSAVIVIVWLLMMCRKGTDGSNRFGPDPLE